MDVMIDQLEDENAELYFEDQDDSEWENENDSSNTENENEIYEKQQNNEGQDGNEELPQFDIDCEL